MITLEQIITQDAEILHGTPVFKGTRVPIQNLWDYLEDGGSITEFLDDFPSVQREQITMLLNYFQTIVEFNP